MIGVFRQVQTDRIDELDSFIGSLDFLGRELSFGGNVPNGRLERLVALAAPSPGWPACREAALGRGP